MNAFQRDKLNKAIAHKENLDADSLEFIEYLARHTDDALSSEDEIYLDDIVNERIRRV